jgi:hypothetical protein
MHIAVGAGHWRGSATEHCQSTVFGTWTWQHDEKKMLSLRQSSKVVQLGWGDQPDKRYESELWRDRATGKALSRKKDGSEQQNGLK